MDLISGVLLILFSLDMDPGKIAWTFAIYLIVKGIIFIKALSSLLDVASGILIILAIFGIVNMLTLLAAVWILQKVFFSFL
jgi:hypothetical protein|tara:strand:- start:10163 stop:10405 length:243 start_codon:yes stop_codon:yes gene_type:complete